MECTQIRPLLSLFASDDVDRDERLAVESHASVCSACSAELDEYRAAIAALNGAAAAAPEPPEGMADRLWAVLRRDVAPPVPVTAGARWLRIAAVFVLGISAGYVAFTLRPRPERTPATAPIIVYNAETPELPESRLVDTGQDDPAWNTGSAPRRWTIPALEQFESHHLQRAEIRPNRIGLIRM